MKIIARSKWGARYGDGNGGRPLPAPEAWLHHSVTIAPGIEWVDANRDGVDDDERAAMRTIEAIGRDRFGEVYGFPYTFAVMPSGRVYAGHAVGQQGAHTGGHNIEAIGIVFVGNYETNKPTDAQLTATAELLRHCKTFGVLKNARLNGGHRDTKSTACPGRYAYAAIAEINRRAAAGVEDDMSAEDVKNIRNDIASLRGLISGNNLGYTTDGDEKSGSLRTITAYTRQDVRAILRAVQGLAQELNADALATQVAAEINRLDAEDVVDAFAARLDNQEA